MSETPSKRPRSNSDVSLQGPDTDSGGGGRRGRSDIHKDPRYDRPMESKSAFLRNSVAGSLPEETKSCKELWSDEQNDMSAEAQPRDAPLGRDFLPSYVTRLLPSTEISSLRQGKIGDSQEGYNDHWLQAQESIAKLPQPDRTVAFRASVFADYERQRLKVQPGTKSPYAACEGMLFPFLTCKAKPGSEGLAIAKRANAYSMAVALRGVVDLFRQAKSEQDIHRTVLGISIAHNASTVELYCHFPEIDGPKTSFFQYRLRTFDYADRDGQDSYTCYKFVRSVYTSFSQRHLERLREAITKLDPLSKPHDLIDPSPEKNPLTPTASDTGATSAKSTMSSDQGLNLKAQNAQSRQNMIDLPKEMARQKQEFQAREASLMKSLSDRQNEI